MEKKFTIYFSGRVQGVGFRYFIKKVADNFNLKGFVKNLPNGKVKLVCETENFNKFKEKLFLELEQQNLIRIKELEIREEESKKEFFNFKISF